MVRDGLAATGRSAVRRGTLTGAVAGAFAALLAAGATPLAAQKACKINDGSPYQINGAKQYLIQVASKPTSDEVPKHLSNAIRNLTTDPEKMRGNEIGRRFLLARAYSSWLDNGGATYVMKRGDLGMTENPEGSHNLLLAIDSSVRYVLERMPECLDEVDRYRNVHYSRVLNRAVDALNEGQNDTAAYYARFSQQVNSTDPRSWNVLAAAFGNMQQRDSAMWAMGKVIEVSGTDTLFQGVAQQARYNLAVMTIEDAAALEGDAKEAKVGRARELLEAYLAISPDDANAKQAQARLAAASGDTAAIADIFADMAENPGNYTPIQLFEAGAAAAGAGQDSVAIMLLENGLTRNANHRDALYNLANIYMSAKRGDDMLTTAGRLTEIEPNNPVNWQLAAAAWQVKRNAMEGDAERKAASDSIIAYITKRDKVNPVVQVFSARSTGEAYEFSGTLRVSGTAAASPTLVVEFLAEDGTVVDTKEQAFGEMASGTQQEFRFEVPGTSVAAYRYTVKM